MPARPDAQIRTPSRLHLSRELLTPKEAVRLVGNGPRLARLDRGAGSVLAIPGLGASDSSLRPLRSFLKRLGYAPVGWGLGLNKGRVEENVAEMIERAEALAGDSDAGKIPIIGWSLGGVIAREVARDRPDLVSRVITFGTPVIGGPRFTVTADSWGAERVDEIDIQVAERNLIPIQAPITAMYSHLDGIVNWRACIDDFSPRVENIRVRSTHVGMGIDPDVWRTVASRLAEPVDR